MSCPEAGLKEEAAFHELERAAAHRQTIAAKLAIYNDHREGSEVALRDVQGAVQRYCLGLEVVVAARSRHGKPNHQPLELK